MIRKGRNSITKSKTKQKQTNKNAPARLENAVGFLEHAHGALTLLAHVLELALEAPILHHQLQNLLLHVSDDEEIFKQQKLFQ
jgi:hypothetical protein